MTGPSAWVPIRLEDLPPATTLGGRPLRPDHVITVEHGIEAAFYEDGALRWVRNHRGGDFRKRWALYLVWGKNEGVARLEVGSGATPDWEEYREGYVERFDAWSDGSPARERDWRDWVTSWLDTIFNTF